MDKYRTLRETVERTSKDIIGMHINDAEKLCKERGLASRHVIHRGKGYMITADCRADRIGFITDEDRLVIGTRNG